MSTRRPSDSGRPDKHKPAKKGYPVARPASPPVGHQRPMPPAVPQGRPAAAKPDPHLVFNLHDPAVPELKRGKRPGIFRHMAPVALVLFVILIGVGTVAFAFTYRKGRKHADANAVAKVDNKEHESEKKPEKKPEASEKKPEEKKPEEKKPAEKIEEKKPVEKKPEEKKPEEKKPEEKKPEEKKPAEKKPEEKKPEEKKPEKPEPKPAVDPKFANIVFEKDILPIFNAKCIFCHGDKKKKGGLDMRTVASMLKGGEGGNGRLKGRKVESKGEGQDPSIPCFHPSLLPTFRFRLPAFSLPALRVTQTAGRSTRSAQ